MKQYTRKPVVVTAIQITDENMEEVAKWCSGEIRTYAKGDTTYKYISLSNRRLVGKGRVGSWVVRIPLSSREYDSHYFGIYSDRGFNQAFDPMGA